MAAKVTRIPYMRVLTSLAHFLIGELLTDCRSMSHSCFLPMAVWSAYSAFLLVNCEQKPGTYVRPYVCFSKKVRCAEC